VVEFQVAELLCALFIVWRVFGLAVTLSVLGWRSYNERENERKRLYAEWLAFRVRGGLPPSMALREMGLSLDEASKAFSSLGGGS
jgi:hypothetical protein